MMTPATQNFFAALTPIRDRDGTFDPDAYRPAPDDWWLAVGDIQDSTGAIARGQYRDVNFTAAALIASLKNLCTPVEIPYLFGGDGAVVLVPPERVEEARLALARVRGLTKREWGLTLRVGIVPVSRLRREGAEVRVARYEPSPGNPFGVFLGGGVGRVEAALKGRGDPMLAAEASIPDTLDDGVWPVLDGLSCRWSELRSGRGRMVSMIIAGASDPGEVYRRILRIASTGGRADPVRIDNLTPRWPPKGLMLEARARRGKRPAWWVGLLILAETLFAWVVLTRNRPLGGFDPQVYRREIATNTDFSKCDDVVAFVLDCDEEAIAALRAELDRAQAAGELTYGMHLSDTAMMTCLVSSLGEHRHVHFVDGGDGGFAIAAQGLKAALRRSVS